MTRRWMMMGTVAVLLLAAVIVVGRSPAMSAQPGPMGPMGPMASMGQPLDQLSGDAFDQAFLREMIMHHAMAVMMAQPVAANGQHQELKDLARALITDQTREIGQMRAWLRHWYGVDMPDPLEMMEMMGTTPGGGMPMDGMDHGSMMGGQGQGMPMGEMGMAMHMGMMADLWALPANRLDAVFMSLMIVHHDGALDMARLALDRAAHAEVKDLAAGIIVGQTAENAQMAAWLAAWYGL